MAPWNGPKYPWKYGYFYSVLFDRMQTWRRVAASYLSTERRGTQLNAAMKLVDQRSHRVSLSGGSRRVHWTDSQTTYQTVTLFLSLSLSLSHTNLCHTHGYEKSAQSRLITCTIYLGSARSTDNIKQEGLAVASIARDVVVEMTPLRDDNAR